MTLQFHKRMFQRVRWSVRSAPCSKSKQGLLPWYGHGVPLGCHKMFFLFFPSFRKPSSRLLNGMWCRTQGTFGPCPCSFPNTYFSRTYLYIIAIIANFCVNDLLFSMSLFPLNHIEPILTPRPYFVVLSFLDANSWDPSISFTQRGWSNAGRACHWIDFRWPKKPEKRYGSLEYF